MATNVIASLSIALGIDAKPMGPALSRIGQVDTALTKVTGKIALQKERWAGLTTIQKNSAQAGVTANKKQEASLRKNLTAMTAAVEKAKVFNSTIRSKDITQGEKQIQLVNQALRAYTAQLQKAKTNQDRLNAAIAFRAKTGAIRGDVAAFAKGKTPKGKTPLTEAAKLAQLRMDKLQASFRNLTSAAVLVTGPLGGVAARLIQLKQALRHGIGALALVLGLAAATFAVFKLGAQVIRTGIELDRIANRLKIVEGVTSLAAAKFNDLAKLAEQTGSVLSVVADQYTRMRQAVKGSTLEGEKFNKIFEGLVLASAAFQLDAEATIGTLKAFEQMISKGNVTAEELKQQLGDRLPGAMGIAAKAMGVTTKELEKMIKAGNLATEDFLPKFVETLLDSLGVKLGDRVETVRASIGRLTTSWFLFNAEINESLGISKKFQLVLDATAGSITALTKNLRTILAVITAVGVALLAWNLQSVVIVGLVSLGGVLIKVAKAFKLAAIGATLFQVVATGGIGAFVKLGVVVSLAIATFFGMRNAMQEVAASNAEASAEVEKFIKLQKLLSGTNVAGARRLLEGTDDPNFPGLHIRLAEARKAYEAELKKFEEALDSPIRGILEFLGSRGEAAMTQAQITLIKELGLEYEKLGDGIQDLTINILDMQKIIARTELTKLLNLAKLWRKLTRQIDDLQASTEALNDGGTDEFIKRQIANRKTVETFRVQAEKLRFQKGFAAVEEQIKKFTESLEENTEQISRNKIRELTKDITNLRAELNILDIGVLTKGDVARRSFLLDQVKIQQEITDKVEERERAWLAELGASDLVTRRVREYEEVLQRIATVMREISIQNLHLTIAEQIGDATRELAALLQGPDISAAFKIDDTVLKTIRDLRNTFLALGVEAPASLDALEAALLRLGHAKPLQDLLDVFHDLNRDMDVLRTATELLNRFNLSFDDASRIARWQEELRALGKTQKEINEFTRTYLELLDKLNKADAIFEGMRLAIEGIEGAWSDAFDSIGDSIVDAFADGKNFLESMADLTRELGKELVKLFLQLSIINPIKNAVLNPAVPFPTVSPAGFLGGGGGATGTLGTIVNPAWVRIFGGAGGGGLGDLGNFGRGGGGGGGGGSVGGGITGVPAFDRTVERAILEPLELTVKEFKKFVDLGNLNVTPGMGIESIRNRFGIGPAPDNLLPAGVSGFGSPVTPVASAAAETAILGQKGGFNEILGKSQASRPFSGVSAGALGGGSSGAGSIGTGFPAGLTEDLQQFSEALKEVPESLESMTAGLKNAEQATQSVASTVGSHTAAVQAGTAAETLGATAKQATTAVETAMIAPKIAESTADTQVATSATQAALPLQLLATQAQTAGIAGVFGFAKGGAFKNGVQFAAKGRVINSPTMFNSSQGPVIGGESGPEAILPLQRGPDGKLGVASTGGRGGTTQTINIYANDVRTVEKSKHQLAAMGWAALRRGVKFQDGL